LGATMARLSLRLFKMMMMVNIKTEYSFLKKVCTGNTLFSSIINIIINQNQRNNKGIIGDNMGIN